MIIGRDMFNVGDRIELIRKESEATKFYPSQILDITEEDTYIVSGPIYKSRLVLLHKYERVVVSCLVENKGRYVFDARILKRDHGKIYKLELEKISDINKFQQREFYRFETSIPVTKKMTIKTKGGEDTLLELCRTKDISGSGMKLLSNFEHEVGDKVKCKFEIRSHPIYVECEILRIENIDTFDYTYGLGVNFIDITEEDRDNIIKFIFEEERLLREKGLI